MGPKKGKKKDDWPSDDDADKTSTKLASMKLENGGEAQAKSKKKSKKMAMLADLAAERESNVSEFSVKSLQYCIRFGSMICLHTLSPE